MADQPVATPGSEEVEEPGEVEPEEYKDTSIRQQLHILKLLGCQRMRLLLMKRDNER
jgi:hypothetical protein